MSFQRTETIICSIVITTAAGVATNPDTNIHIGIKNPVGTAVVAATTDMTNDSTGHYHYDYTPAAGTVLGEYEITYTLTNAGRTTISKDSFILEA